MVRPQHAHTRLRRLINAGFTPRMVEKLDERIREYTVRILDSVVEQGGEVDFVREVANELPDAHDCRDNGNSRA